MFIFKVAASDMATTTAMTTTKDVSDSSDERRGVIFDVVSFSFKVGFKVSIEPLRSKKQCETIFCFNGPHSTEVGLKVGLNDTGQKLVAD